MINALQGTRMGRPVKTPQQAMEEAQEWARQNDLESKVEPTGEFEPTLAGEELPGGTSTLSSVDAGDIFKFSNLEHSKPGGISLTNLEVPEGKWAKLHLVHDSYGGQRYLSQKDWVSFSNGAKDFISGTSNLAINKVLTHPRVHLATAKAIYWFLRAAYESRNDPQYEKIVKEIIKPYPDGFLKSALTADALFRHQARGPDMTDLHTFGWPENHPIKIHGAISTPPFDKYNVHPTTRIQGLLYHLFGDPNPDRINEVFTWASKSNGQTTFHSEPFLRENQGAVYLDFENNNIALVPRDSPGQAFGLYAFANEFKPRVKP